MGDDGTIKAKYYLQEISIAGSASAWHKTLSCSFWARLTQKGCAYSYQRRLSLKYLGDIMSTIDLKPKRIFKTQNPSIR